MTHDFNQLNIYKTKLVALESNHSLQIVIHLFGGQKTSRAFSSDHLQGAFSCLHYRSNLAEESKKYLFFLKTPSPLIECFTCDRSRDCTQGKLHQEPAIAWNGFARKCDDSQTKIVIFMHTAKVNDQTFSRMSVQIWVLLTRRDSMSYSHGWPLIECNAHIKRKQEK